MKIWICIINIIIALPLFAQDSTAINTGTHKNYGQRKLLVGGLSVGIYGGTLVALNEAWYKGYPKSSFHTFNDSREWMQMDKIGHGWSVYNLSRGSASVWQWAGLEKKQAILAGSLSGLSFLTVVEVLDAHSANWGWSWADMGANLFGSGLFAIQELGWNEQKIQYKFSAVVRSYDNGLNKRANDLYGSSGQEKLLKDYNGQSYWLSANLRSITGSSKIPSWLNVAIGYGAEGLYGGFENLAYDEAGNIVFDRRDVKRYRQWYLSPDIDLTKIRTNSKFIRSTLFCLNMFKFPAPAIEYSNGSFKARLLHF